MYVEKQALVAMGSNLPLGDIAPELMLEQAIDCLGMRGFGLIACSRFYRTPAFPAGAAPDFVNAVFFCKLPPESDAEAVLRVLHEVEAVFGRERSQRWGARTLDLDLLAIGQQVLPDPAIQAQWRALSSQDQMRLVPDQVILPHPRMQDRAFVLVPLADVAPDWVHPTLGLSVSQMLAALPEHDLRSVVPF